MASNRIQLWSKYVERNYLLPNEQVRFFYRKWVPKWLAWLISKYFLGSVYQRVETGAARGRDER